jgi:hypothetical protein
MHLFHTKNTNIFNEDTEIIENFVCYLLVITLQNPTLGDLIVEEGKVLGCQTGIWSTEAKVWCIMLKAAWQWGGDSSLANNPPTWGSAGDECFIHQFLWD